MHHNGCSTEMPLLRSQPRSEPEEVNVASGVVDLRRAKRDASRTTAPRSIPLALRPALE
jgi:hypothetical protein